MSEVAKAEPLYIPKEVVDLGRGKGNASDEKLKAAYDAWANTHDKDANETTYLGPKSLADCFVSVINEHFPHLGKDIKIIDLGCGTGQLAAELVKRGYVNVDGMDISQGMLNVAKEKNIYKRLFCCRIRDALEEDLHQGEFDAVVSAGLFAMGVVQCNEIDVMVDLMKPGSIFCSTFRQADLNSPELGYKKKFQEFVDKKKLELISSQMADYINMPSSKDHEVDQCYILTYKAL